MRDFLKKEIEKKGFPVRLGTMGKSNINQPIVILHTPIEEYKRLAQSPKLNHVKLKITAEICAFEKKEILTELDELAFKISPVFDDLLKVGLVQDILLDESAYALDPSSESVFGSIRLSFTAFYEGF